MKWCHSASGMNCCSAAALLMACCRSALFCNIYFCTQVSDVDLEYRVRTTEQNYTIEGTHLAIWRSQQSALYIDPHW